MSGAAARLGRAKGKDRAASHGHTQSLAMPVENGSLPIPAAGTSGSPYQYNLAASPNPSQHSSSSPEMETSARFAGGTGLSRRESAKSRFIFGVRVPTGKAGEVFGAPIRVAADRTKLSEDKWIDLPGAGMHEAERRREACKVLPAGTALSFPFVSANLTLALLISMLLFPSFASDQSPYAVSTT